MYGDIGKFFFHYTKADTAFRHILPSGKLRLSSYGRMQDPPEAHPWTFGASYSPDAIDNSTAAERLMQLSDLANQVKDSAKLLSLTVDAPGWEDPFGRGWARASMWELYAKQHTGACLLFDRARLIEVLTPQLKGEGQAFCDPVRYTITPTRDIATPFQGSDLESTDPAETIERHLNLHREALFFTKLAYWAGESEYRFVVINEPSDYFCCAFEDSLRAVFVGRKFPGGELDDAMAVTSEAGAEFRKLTWQDGFPRPAKGRH